MEKINNGGPAFPEGIAVREDGKVYGGKNSGMTLRDYFASAAMHGIIANEGVCLEEDAGLSSEYAKKAYRYADAMLIARNSNLEE